jgi:hypothetical protein
MTLFTNEDIEHCFVREFSVGGDTFGPNSSREYRRERMRVAIFKAGKEGRAFFDSGMTYAEAYRRCFGTPLELRGMVRGEAPTMHRPNAGNLDDLMDDDE